MQYHLQLQQLLAEVFRVVKAYRPTLAQLLSRGLGQSLGHSTRDVTQTINTLLRLLGLELRQPNRPEQTVHLRCKEVPRLPGGAVELRLQEGGARRVVSSRKSFPDTVGLGDTVPASLASQDTVTVISSALDMTSPETPMDGEQYLKELRGLRLDILEALQPFRDRFSRLLAEGQGRSFGQYNPDVAETINTLLRLLGLELRDPDDTTRVARLRHKRLPRVTDGAFELRSQADGERKILSSRKALPDKLVIRVSPDAHLR